MIDGRKDWMFISGGENIQPEEIERELLLIPEVLEAVVIGKNDPEFGKRPVAFVRAEKTFDFKRMQTVLCNKLPKYKIPIELHLIDELPKRNDFKVDRFILSQHINGQLDRNISGQKKEPYL
jgi:O-succinylbenzoic acid--CoA ligase